MVGVELPYHKDPALTLRTRSEKEEHHSRNALLFLCVIR